MDGDGTPLAFNITPGNTNEQTTLTPTEQKILDDFKLSKFIVCTDAGLASVNNRKFNNKEDRSFITTQSIKQLKKHLKEWALSPIGWKLNEDLKEYDISKLEDSAEEIIKVNKRRWEIEESFRIMKSEFKARPVYLSRDDRITTHFTTCFLSLVFHRYLEKELEEKYHYLKYLDTKDIQYELEKSLIQLQKVFLKCFQIKIKNAVNKQNIISLMYQFRYYLLLPFDIESNVFDKIFVNKNINNILTDTVMNLLDKAKELKAITVISKNKEYEYKIWIEIFKLRVIKLEDLSFKLIKEKDKFFMQVFDEGAFEEKIEIFNDSIKSKDLGIKLNKKIKLFE